MSQQKIGTRRRIAILALGTLLTLSVGAAALELFEVPIDGLLNPGELFQLNYDGLANTGFTIRSLDGSPFSILGVSTYDADAGLQPGETVQEGFVLLDGTLSVDISALKSDGVRALTRTTYRLNIRRDSLRFRQIARALFRQGVVGDSERALTRARAMRLADARVMRLVEGREGHARWIRAVRALSNPRIRTFRERKAPDGVLGHFGTALSDAGEPYVWAVMDRNSRYAVGLTVDRDNDGVPNAADNCIGTVNSNQSDADGDAAGDACDLDDDNDGVADESDNCPLTANTGQQDLDGDGLGDACDVDDDNDGVADGNDQCLATTIGEVVNANGCSIADQCPCEGDWRNHGAYVQCVARTSGLFASAGLITAIQKDAIVSAGARSTCGF
jgi:hypothetical protein